MADKKVPQEDCLMCGEFPCVCVGSERRTRVIKRQVKSGFLTPSLQGTKETPETSGKTDISGQNTVPSETLPSEVTTSADSTDADGG